MCDRASIHDCNLNTSVLLGCHAPNYALKSVARDPGVRSFSYRGSLGGKMGANVKSILGIRLESLILGGFMAAGAPQRRHMQTFTIWAPLV